VLYNNNDMLDISRDRKS